MARSPGRNWRSLLSGISSTPIGSRDRGSLAMGKYQAGSSVSSTPSMSFQSNGLTRYRLTAISFSLVRVRTVGLSREEKSSRMRRFSMRLQREKGEGEDCLAWRQALLSCRYYWCLWERAGVRKLQARPSSSSQRLRRTMRLGMIQNMLGSLQSTSSLKWSYFSLAASTMELNATICLSFLGSRKYLFPFSQELSYSCSASTSSGLFFSCGSTISKFSPKKRNTSLTFPQLYRMRQASALTDLDCSSVTVARTFSAAARISKVRSSLPFPSKLATELSLLIFSQS